MLALELLRFSANPKPMFFLLQQSTLRYTLAEVNYLRADLVRGRGRCLEKAGCTEGRG